MAKPTHKSQALERFLNNLLAPGVERRESIERDTCVLCGEPATKFRDEISEREFKISGMCQSCQDYHFGAAQPD